MNRPHRRNQRRFNDRRKEIHRQNPQRQNWTRFMSVFVLCEVIVLLVLPKSTIEILVHGIIFVARMAQGLIFAVLGVNIAESMFLYQETRSPQHRMSVFKSLMLLIFSTFMLSVAYGYVYQNCLSNSIQFMRSCHRGTCVGACFAQPFVFGLYNSTEVVEPRAVKPLAM